MRNLLNRIFKKEGIKVWHFSDTHRAHGFVPVPKNIDIAIFSGDCSNHRNPITNAPEVIEFLEWFAEQPIKNKIMIAGNHDTSIEQNIVTKEEIESYGITYLYNNSITVEGIKIWGSPYTPVFGSWAFMKPRHKLDAIWQSIPDDTDIIITHGPPKGALDISYNFDKTIERCGCSALMKRIVTIEPKIVMYGHIHNGKDLLNSGYFKSSTLNTIFSNGTICSNSQQVIGNGNVFNL